MADVKDLVNHSLNQKPSDFMDTFNDLILGKLQTAVADRKQEVAQNLLGGTPPEEPDEEEYEEPEYDEELIDSEEEDDETA